MMKYQSFTQWAKGRLPKGTFTFLAEGITGDSLFIEGNLLEMLLEPILGPIAECSELFERVEIRVRKKSWKRLLDSLSREYRKYNHSAIIEVTLVEDVSPIY